MERKIESKVQGFHTQDGAGVQLVRVLGNRTVKEYDPILMLDSFDSMNPDDYTAGFPMHPHRGIETISYVVSGAMQHRDSLGSTDTIADGEVQWMTAGSGIMHEELIPAAERLLGVQLWLNLPAAEKMTEPAYHSIRSSEIPEQEIPGGKIRVLAGSCGEVKGFQAPHLPFDYFDIRLQKNTVFRLETDPEQAAMLFTLQGSIKAAGEGVLEKTAVRLTAGDYIEIETGDEEACILYMGSRELGEPVCWGGPIVMNTEEELDEAFSELQQGTFLKSGVSYK